MGTHSTLLVLSLLENLIQHWSLAKATKLMKPDIISFAMPSPPWDKLSPWLPSRWASGITPFLGESQLWCRGWNQVLSAIAWVTPCYTMVLHTCLMCIPELQAVLSLQWQTWKSTAPSQEPPGTTEQAQGLTKGRAMQRRHRAGTVQARTSLAEVKLRSEPCCARSEGSSWRRCRCGRRSEHVRTCQIKYCAREHRSIWEEGLHPMPCM